MNLVAPERSELVVKADAQLRVIADETGLDFDSLADAYHKADLVGLAISNGPALEWSPVHHFSDGLYACEQAMPAGMLAVGAVPRTEHLCVISKGAMHVWTPFESPRILRAPYLFTVKPGMRPVAEILEDFVWTCFHATQTTDLTKLHRELYFPYDNPLLDQKGVG